LNFLEVPRVAGREACLEFIHACEKREACTDLCFPAWDVFGLSEDADLRRLEIFEVSLGEDIVCGKRLVSAAILNDIAVDLQDPESSQQYFVNRPRSEPRQVLPPPQDEGQRAVLALDA